MSVTHDGLTFDRPGHATVRIETDDGRVVYVDPWSDVLDDEPGDGDSAEQSSAGSRPARQDGDVVFVTHDDFDHWDPEAIDAVAKDDATIAVYERVDTTELDRDVVDLPADGTVTVDGIEVETYPAYNESDGEHVDDEGNPFHAEGEVIGLRLDIDGTTVYIPSDTDFLDELADVDADVFLPPIGGHYTMDRHEAADFAESVDPKLVLPIHYDTFDPIETDADAFVEDVEGRGLEVELF